MARAEWRMLSVLGSFENVRSIVSKSRPVFTFCSCQPLHHFCSGLQYCSARTRCLFVQFNCERTNLCLVEWKSQLLVHDSKDLLSCPAWNNILFSYCSCLLTVAVDLNPQTDESAVHTPRRNCSEAGSDISCAMSAAGRHASFRLCGVASVCMIYGCSLVEPPPPSSPFRHCHCVSTNNIHSSTCRDHIV